MLFLFFLWSHPVWAHQHVSVELFPLPAGSGTCLLGEETCGWRCCPDQTDGCSCPLWSACSPADGRPGPRQQRLPCLAEPGSAEKPPCRSSAKGWHVQLGEQKEIVQPQPLDQGLQGLLLLSRPLFGMRRCEGQGGTPPFFAGLGCHQVYISLQVSLLVSIMSQYWVVHQVLQLPVVECVLATIAKVNSCLVTLAFHLCIRNKNHCSLKGSTW